MKHDLITAEIERVAAQRWNETSAGDAGDETDPWRAIRAAARRQNKQTRERMQRRIKNCRIATHFFLIALAWAGIAWLYYHEKVTWREAGLMMVGVLALNLWWQNRRNRQRKGTRDE